MKITNLFLKLMLTVIALVIANFIYQWLFSQDWVVAIERSYFQVSAILIAYLSLKVFSKTNSIKLKGMKKMKVTKEASDMTVRVWAKIEGIFYLQYDYLKNDGEIITCDIEIPITDKNKHLKVGDEIEMQLLMEVKNEIHR